MISLAWLLRMKRWVQNPPSMGRVIFVLTVIAICIALVIVERIWGWPEALTPHSGGRGRMPF